MAKKVGDLVIAREGSGEVLASGCGRYSCAVIIQLEPFIITTPDMTWSKIDPDNMQSLVQVHPDLVKTCIEKLPERDRPIPKEAINTFEEGKLRYVRQTDDSPRKLADWLGKCEIYYDCWHHLKDGHMFWVLQDGAYWLFPLTGAYKN